MIDKKKLLEKTKSVRCADEIRLAIENFPEEPEIDFDALWKEHKEFCIKREVKCWSCCINTEDNGGETCFTNFLKSKHLSAPKPKQFPVKKVWTLKKKYEDFVFACGIPNVTIKYCCGEPEHKEFYDLTETPDYSQVKVGDVVEVEFKNGIEQSGYVQRNENNYISIGVYKEYSGSSYTSYYEEIKSLTILKAAE